MYDDWLYLWYCPLWSFYYNDSWNFDFKYNTISHIAIDAPGLTDGGRAPDVDDTEDTDETVITQTLSVTGFLSLWGNLNRTETTGAFPGSSGMSNTGLLFNYSIFVSVVLDFCFFVGGFYFWLCFCLFKGWYWRSIYSASPELMYLGNTLQIPPKSFVMFAIRYPENTKFNVTIHSQYQSTYFPCPEAKSFDDIAYSTEDLYDNYTDWTCEQDFSLDNTWFSLCNDTGYVLCLCSLVFYSFCLFACLVL